MIQLVDIVPTVDLAVDHHLADDEAVSQVDEVEDEEVEEAGKKIRLFKIIILYFFIKCLY